MKIITLERHGIVIKGPYASHLSRELGIPVAEIARHLGVCTSAIAKVIQKVE